MDFRPFATQNLLDMAFSDGRMWQEQVVLAVFLSCPAMSRCCLLKQHSSLLKTSSGIREA